MAERPYSMTVGELREWLAEYPNDAPLTFGQGDLSFYRVKNRGPIGGFHASLEFGQIYVVTVDPEAD